MKRESFACHLVDYLRSRYGATLSFIHLSKVHFLLEQFWSPPRTPEVSGCDMLSQRSTIGQCQAVSDCVLSFCCLSIGTRTPVELAADLLLTDTNLIGCSASQITVQKAKHISLPFTTSYQAYFRLEVALTCIS